MHTRYNQSTRVPVRSLCRVGHPRVANAFYIDDQFSVIVDGQGGIVQYLPGGIENLLPGIGSKVFRGQQILYIKTGAIGQVGDGIGDRFEYGDAGVGKIIVRPYIAAKRCNLVDSL